MKPSLQAVKPLASTGQANMDRSIGVTSSSRATTSFVLQKEKDQAANVKTRQRASLSPEPVAILATTAIPTSSTITNTKSNVSPQNNILDTFFSLMDEDEMEKIGEQTNTEPLGDAMDLDEPVEVPRTIEGPSTQSSPMPSQLLAQNMMPKEGCNCQSAGRILPGLTASRFATAGTASDQGHLEVRPGHKEHREDCPLRKGVRKSQVHVGDRKPRGKPNENDKQESSGLRPQAPGFVPKVGVEKVNDSLIIFDENIKDFDFTCTGNDAKTLHQNSSTGESLIMPSGPATGHIVTVTPVQFADGFLVPGSTTGQLWLQTPVDYVPVGTFPNRLSTQSGHLPLSESAANTSGYRNSVASTMGRPTAVNKKPTKGLSASMWA